MKPKMLIWGGFGWCASSPLVYTLQRNAKYAHFGYTKVWRYFPKEEEEVDTEFFQRVFDGTWENYKSHEPATHRLNLSVDLEPLRDFPLSHLKKLGEGERTEKNLIDFYHALYDHVITKGYKSVGDYNYRENCFLGNEKKYNELLMSEFDIKVLAIVRDPIRRTFSRYLNKKHHSQTKNLILSNLKGSSMKITDYIKKISALYKTFGKNRTHITVMEELWEGDGTAKKELSQFLDHPITDLWKNLYAPDRGHLVEFDKDVPCQAFGQHLAELTPEMYYQYRKDNDHVYQAWRQEFGSLPLHWGEPIEYS